MTAEEEKGDTGTGADTVTDTDTDGDRNPDVHAEAAVKTDDRSADAAPWVGLFSGGKDSSWALYQALSADRPVRRLVTVHPDADSYMYHVPATELATLAAESIGLPLTEVRLDDTAFDGAPPTDSGARGDAELAVLERTLERLREEWGAIGGVTAGAVASDYQTDRIRAMCDRLGAEAYAPLYGKDPVALAEAMLAAGFEIRIVAVAARGLDEGWLDRQLDAEALAALRDLNERHGVHVLGEGGEFETVVVDGPHMTRRIAYEATPVWEGTRGHLEISDAWLEPTDHDVA